MNFFRDLSHNLLNLVPEEMLRSARKLVSINLSTNRLTQLPDGLLEGQIRLEEINLSDNALQVLRKDVFKGLTGVKKLKLNHNELTTLPPGMSQLDENSYHFLICAEINVLKKIFKQSRIGDLKKPTVKVGINDSTL